MLWRIIPECCSRCGRPHDPPPGSRFFGAERKPDGYWCRACFNAAWDAELAFEDAIANMEDKEFDGIDED